MDASNIIDVIAAADDNYAMPLAVAVASVCQRLDPNHRIRLFLLARELSDANLRRLEDTFRGNPIDLRIIEPDVGMIADLSVSHHISHAAYYRLLAGELLPQEIDKAIYLDCDVLVCDDLLDLWRQPLADNYCLATVDIACPYIDARLGCQNFRRANPYMASLQPVRNYLELGLDGRSEYFNSGVMVLNLDRWRRENIAHRLLKTLRDHRRHVWCWDQYALNVLFHKNWGRFDPRWNQGAHVYEYPDARRVPIDVQEWQTMKNNPSVIHFTTEFKPWHPKVTHPSAELFFDVLNDTAWHAWQPDPRSLTARDHFNRGMFRVIKSSTITSRKLVSMWP